ncbi:DTW domain-containing protein [Vibrio aestuarianus]|uniref:tRNA-uridine aminocarboxypropyltransferase n=1 Tax=Vibrio aestuarianus TaxID=28171 RepID=UPI00237CFCC5|nr:DTW domain-containing protein [Vibrio aestuarianus]MDE1315033.1 DTW domain-containing protein [Vibrio aestuarianus]
MSRYCSQCGKSLKACICASIVPLASSVELIILQHPTEEHRPMGTARILDLSLANSMCLVGEDFSQHKQLNALLSEPDIMHYVLYPSDVSRCASELSTLLPVKKIRLILLDGTWKKAYKMWQLSCNLHALPSVHLPKDLVGNYRIRKAPSENSLSTVEAGYHILSLLEPERNFQPLMTAFEQMIEFQIAQMPPGVFERNYLNK